MKFEVIGWPVIFESVADRLWFASLIDGSDLMQGYRTRNTYVAKNAKKNQSRCESSATPPSEMSFIDVYSTTAIILKEHRAGPESAEARVFEKRGNRGKSHSEAVKQENLEQLDRFLCGRYLHCEEYQNSSETFVDREMKPFSLLLFPHIYGARKRHA